MDRASSMGSKVEDEDEETFEELQRSPLAAELWGIPAIISPRDAAILAHSCFVDSQRAISRGLQVQPWPASIADVNGLKEGRDESEAAS
mmetsp:Transcript_51167/g.108727  ORF Transcript_51167/g.108727 Transcript_51167/m.108727 type:complete len:89 (-) Transcript_51167:330-596(-)